METGAIEIVESRTEDPEVVVATPTYVDHFTLPLPSSTVRLRNTADSTLKARILEDETSQIVLEEVRRGNQLQIKIKLMKDSTTRLNLLRATYSLVCALWTGFLFCVCLQVLLYLVLDLAIEIGQTSLSDANVPVAMGVVLAIPPLVYSLASALVIAGYFVRDTWQGHFLVTNFVFGRMSKVTVEWIFFCAFLGLPAMTLCLSLLAQAVYWWEVTALFWFSCVSAFYLLFTINVVWYEIRACWEVSKNMSNEDIDSFPNLVARSILLRQVHDWSGKKNITYMARGSVDEALSRNADDAAVNRVKGTREESVGLWTRLTLWDKLKEWGLFEHLDQPQRVYTVQDAQEIRPYVTSNTWSLEKFFCRPRNSRLVAIVKGPAALTRAQMKSSLVCSVLGTCLIILFVVSLAVWMGIGGGLVAIIVAIGVLAAIPTIRSTRRLYRVGKDLIYVRNQDKDEDVETNQEAGLDAPPEEEEPPTEPTDKEQSEGIYLVSENVLVTRASTRFCWIVFGLEIAFLFVWPLASLFTIGNYPVAILFMLITSISGLRYFVNAGVVLEETGHMNLVDGVNPEEKWRNMSRLNSIVGGITKGGSRSAWTSVLGTFGFVFIGLLLLAVGQEAESTVSTSTFLDDFTYPKQESLPYPTCQLQKGFGDGPVTTLADFAFLAGLAYKPAGNVTQYELDRWFGDDVAIERQDVVQAFRDREEVSSAVSFKLVTFPNYDGEGGEYGMVVIRGTQTPWDMFADAQLWSAAMLMQILRAFLPFGNMWTPIFPQLVATLKALQSESIERVSFYKHTSKFVEEIRDQYSAIGVTGHSLGGGLSMITGAQTKVPAVALSGPNAIISRRSFDPPLTLDALNTYTFNIVPARDVVPQFDDVAQFSQNIRCEADANDFVGCHTATRSLCEIMYTCGTGFRPALCECSTFFGYPFPQATGDRDFETACGQTESLR